MNEKTVRALIEAGAVKKVILIANGASIHVDIVTQSGTTTATTNKGSVKTWASIDSSAKWIKAMGVGQVQLNIVHWLPYQKGLNV